MNHYFWSSDQNKNWFNLGQTSDMKERQHMDMNYCRTLFEIHSKCLIWIILIFSISKLKRKNMWFSSKIQNRKNDIFSEIFKHCDFYDTQKENWSIRGSIIFRFKGVKANC